MKRFLFKNLVGLALIGVVAMTALAGPRPFHLVKHGLITATPRDVNANVGHADLIYEWTGGTGRFEHATGTTIWSVDVANG